MNQSIKNPSPLKHLRLLSTLVACLTLAFAQPVSAAETGQADLVIYGGTSAGIAAAVQVKRMGLSVVVIEPGRRIGGLTTGGLGQTDIGNKGVIGGIAREFYRNVATHYSDDANWKWQPRGQYRDGGQTRTKGSEDTQWTFEPSAALSIYKRWVAENEIPVVYGERLKREGEGRTVRRDNGWPVAEPGSVSAGVEKKDGRITALVMESGRRFPGRYFMDATYEGDLMAGAGVSFTIGREGFDVYAEDLNGVQAGRADKHQLAAGIDPYVEPGNPKSGLLPMIDPDGPGKEGSSDHRIQAYNFRMCLTNDPRNRIPFHKPDGYREQDFELLFRNFEAGQTKVPWINSQMPNMKTDTNNRLGFSTDFIGGNYNYPEGSYEERQLICAAHLLYQQGLMWSLAYHPRVPEAVRQEVSRWGMTKDEFVEGKGWQDQIYVREARRLVSDYVMTQHNCQGREYPKDSVGMAAYTMDSHHTQRYVTPEGFVQNEGDVQVKGFPPYPISYRSIIPRKAECANLSVPVMLSASHIAFGSIRMEPVFMILGQSAATATALAIAKGENTALQDVDYQSLRQRLLADGQLLEIPEDQRVFDAPKTGPPAAAGGLMPLNALEGTVVDVTAARLEGPWAASSVKSGVHEGYFHDGNTAKGECTATFIAALPSPGRYRVDVAWQARGNRASNVPMTVSHADGETEKLFNQRQQGQVDRYFTTIGTFEFGPTGTVVIGNQGTDGHVIVDAVRWLPAE